MNIKQIARAGALALLSLCPAVLRAAAPVYSNDFVAVTLDGVRLGTDLDASNLSLMPSVVYDEGSGVFHMWVLSGSSQSLEGLRHATSTDGVHFTSTGNLSFAGGNPFPIHGAPAEPPFVFPRAARIGSDWKLLLWTHNEPGITGDYNYNESLNDIGADPATLAVTHRGPVYPTDGTGTYGQTTGPFGIVDGNLYVADDRPGGISKWDLDDTTPPSVATPADRFQDLITGTGYVFFLTHPGDPLGVYVHNIGRVLDQGDGTLGVYYSLRYPDGSRVDQQIYYAQSGDGGQTWSAPSGIFGNGAAVRVDGEPNAFPFSHPEVTVVGTRRLLYFSTKAADGASVVATSAAQPPSPGSWSGLFGSGVDGDGENGHAVIRTSDGGYAIAGNSSGLTDHPVGFWLLKLDGSGEVEWQKIYTGPITYPRFATSLAEAADGGLVIAGQAGSIPDQIQIIKVDALGEIVWSTALSTSDFGNVLNSISALIRTSDGGFALAGSIAGQFGMAKLDADGALVWIRAYPAGEIPGLVGGLGLVESPDGGLAAVGAFPVGTRVLKTDSAGAIVWDETFATASLSGIANRPGGGFVVLGSPVTALDADGAVLWQKSYSGLPQVAIVSSTAGGYGAVSGSAEGALLAEIDSSGEPLWAKRFAAQATSTAGFYALTATFDGGFLAVGEDRVGADSRLLAVKVDAGGDFVGCLDVETSYPFTAVAANAPPAPFSGAAVDELANTTVTSPVVTATPTDAARRIVCRATLPGDLTPAALAVDPNGNGVAEPSEPVVVDPSWTNFALAATSLSGHVSAESDSNGLDTSGPDPDAGYGTIPSLATADCADATGDCYQFGFQPSPRPAQHWDTYADETLTTSDPHHQFAKRWVIHIGASFPDVSTASGFYPFIENLFHNGVTAGCGGGSYCPSSSTTRAQMAAFLLKSKYGASHVPPPATGTVFADVPAAAPFAAWIEELASLGVTAGCGGGNYCPNDAVNRQQMSAFLLKTLEGSGYAPPPAVGLFADVPLSNGFAPWIEDLYNRQITAGCGTGPLVYCPAEPNTRQQMAVFLVKTFSLKLYAP